MNPRHLSSSLYFFTFSPMKFDLHFHTTLSDGLKTPAEVLAIAEDRGIDFLACTDHDLINTTLPELAEHTNIETIQ